MRTNIKFRLSFLGIAGSVAILVGCGGGIPHATTPVGTVASTLSFPLKAALDAVTANGASFTLHANGTLATQATDGACTGTLTVIQTPANTAVTFEGTSALQSTSVVRTDYTNCAPASATSTETDYFDSSSYLPLGFSVQGGQYGVYRSAPTIPVTVTVGMSGVIGTVDIFTDSTKVVSAGHADRSYIIEADTATTAIANAITRTYNAANTLLSTSQVRYRIDALGSFTAVSEDVQTASQQSSIHVVFK